MNQSKYDNVVARFGFLMSSSFLLIFGVNLSVVAFLWLLFMVLATRESRFFRFHYLKTTALLFFAGAAISSASNLWLGNYDLFWSSMEVLPNYFYWTLIVIVFVTIGDQARLDYDKVFGWIALGVVSVAAYYVALAHRIGDDRFLKLFPPNTVSFMLICFTPYAVYWLRGRSRPAAVALLAALVLMQAMDGRRAGFLLVMAGGTLAFFVSLMQVGRFNRLLRLAAAVGVALVMLQSPAAQSFLEERSDRIAALLYDDVDSLSSERSYLTRMAMLEKGMNLWRDNRLFGVGLNNFTKLEGHFDGNFEGAELVIHKTSIRVVASSHNSYLNLLAEGGLVLIVPFALLMLLLLFGALRHWKRMSDFDKVILISFCAMLIHLAFINAIINSVAWFNIAMLAYAVTSLRRLPQPATVTERPRPGRTLERAVAVSTPRAGKRVAGPLRPHWG